MITNTSWGGDLTSTTKMYRIDIRSKLDYGCQVYSSATPSILKQLNSTTNDALRISTGCFRSTPIETLHNLAGEIPLGLRRENLILRHFFKIKASLSNLSFNYLISNPNRKIFIHRRISPPLAVQANELVEKYRLRKNLVKPEFNYFRYNICKPTFSIEQPNISFDLNSTTKNDTPVEQFQRSFLLLCQTEYLNHRLLFTDGSKKEGGVGAAVYHNGRSHKVTLPKESSIFTAELYAIEMAINLIKTDPSNENPFVIFSDSSNSLRALRNPYYEHSVTRRILHKIEDIQCNKNKIIKMCWVPSHVGIRGNEVADEAANSVANLQEEHISIN